MVTFAREPPAMRVWCDEDDLWVELDDGRKIATPLAYFPGSSTRQLPSDAPPR